MTGPEHYRRAEELAAEAYKLPGQGDGQATLDQAAGAWAQQRTAPSPGARRVIAVDGKTLRGSVRE